MVYGEDAGYRPTNSTVHSRRGLHQIKATTGDLSVLDEIPSWAFSKARYGSFARSLEGAKMLLRLYGLPELDGQSIIRSANVVFGSEAGYDNSHGAANLARAYEKNHGKKLSRFEAILMYAFDGPRVKKEFKDAADVEVSEVPATRQDVERSSATAESSSEEVLSEVKELSADIEHLSKVVASIFRVVKALPGSSTFFVAVLLILGGLMASPSLALDLRQAPVADLATLNASYPCAIGWDGVDRLVKAEQRIYWCDGFAEMWKPLADEVGSSTGGGMEVACPAVSGTEVRVWDSGVGTCLPISESPEVRHAGLLVGDLGVLNLSDAFDVNLAPSGHVDVDLQRSGDGSFATISGSPAAGNFLTVDAQGALVDSGFGGNGATRDKIESPSGLNYILVDDAGIHFFTGGVERMTLTTSAAVNGRKSIGAGSSGPEVDFTSVPGEDTTAIRVSRQWNTGLGAINAFTGTLRANGLTAAEYSDAAGGSLVARGAYGAKPLDAPPTACNSASLGLSYVDTSAAKCWCDGSSWLVEVGAGSCA